MLFLIATIEAYEEITNAYPLLDRVLNFLYYHAARLKRQKMPWPLVRWSSIVSVRCLVHVGRAPSPID